MSKIANFPAAYLVKSRVFCVLNEFGVNRDTRWVRKSSHWSKRSQERDWFGIGTNHYYSEWSENDACFTQASERWVGHRMGGGRRWMWWQMKRMKWRELINALKFCARIISSRQHAQMRFCFFVLLHFTCPALFLSQHTCYPPSPIGYITSSFPYPWVFWLLYVCSGMSWLATGVGEDTLKYSNSSRY